MYVLGVDGGGSQTRALLCDGEGRILGRGLSGPSNPRATPAAEWRSNLSSAIRAACGAVDAGEIRAAHLGIAGAGDATLRAPITEAARGLLSAASTRISVGHDLATALEGGLVGEPGIVLIAGTGSACYGRGADGRVSEVGGWGDLVDDAGGGSWIGLRALQASVRQSDGRLPESALTETVTAFLGIGSMADFKTRIHDQGLSRKERAALAPPVIALAEAGDIGAKDIVAEAVAELCRLAQSARGRLGLPRPTIVLSGGLNRKPHFKASLGEALKALDMNAHAPRLTATAGAVLLALKAAGRSPGLSAAARLAEAVDPAD